MLESMYLAGEESSESHLDCFAEAAENRQVDRQRDEGGMRRRKKREGKFFSNKCVKLLAPR
jgi:hypothetical protein